MPSGPDYAKRILDETRRVLDPRISALQVAFESLKNHLLTSISQLTPQLEAIQGIVLPTAEGIVTEAMKEAAWQNQVEVNLLAEFANGMRRKETQEEILSLLLDTAHQFAHGVALFVVRGDEIAGWSSRGFSPDTAARFGSCSFALADSALLQKALGGDAILTVTHPPEESRLQEMFQDEPLISWHFLPMKALQRRIAVLVACDSGARLCNLDSLRILMDFTSLCVENLALKILQELRTTDTPAPEAASQPSVSETLPAVPGAAPHQEPELSSSPVFSQPEAVPLQSAEIAAPAVEESALPAGEEISTFGAIESAPQPMEKFETPGLAEAVFSALASIQPAAAQPVEIPQPLIPTPVIQEPVVTPAIEEPVMIPVARAPMPPAMSPEEQKLQVDARRFARLLVSEIKLYNEQRLFEAKSGGQIYLRLKRDIDRSREMYEKRFPSSSSLRADHFHEELVRILAENDPAKLGGEYPGPRVES
jgi:hypothetical protein